MLIALKATKPTLTATAAMDATLQATVMLERRPGPRADSIGLWPGLLSSGTTSVGINRLRNSSGAREACLLYWSRASMLTPTVVAPMASPDAGSKTGMLSWGWNIWIDYMRLRLRWSVGCPHDQLSDREPITLQSAH